MYGTTSRFASDSSSRLRAALDHARDGWAVFPVWWAVNRTCACPKGAACQHPGKHPLFCRNCDLRHGFKEASHDPETIRCWWQHHPLANIGGATGAISSRDAIDIDPRHGGHLEQTADGRLLIFDHGRLMCDLPCTRLHASGGGGWHVIVLYRSAPRMDGGLAVALKSDGGYIILPGSVHESGGRYAVLDPSPPCAPYAANTGATNERRDNQASPSWIHKIKTRRTPDLEDHFAAIEMAALARGGRRRGAEIQFQCPFHDDEHPSCHYHTIKHVFHCKACGAAGGWQRLGEQLTILTGTHTPDAIRQRIEEMYRLSLTAPWPGRTGGTDLAVLHVLLAAAWKHRRLVIALDYRSISLAAGVCLWTVTHATRRLSQRRGWRWLFRERQGRFHVETAAVRNASATVWRVAIPAQLRRGSGCCKTKHSEATKTVRMFGNETTEMPTVWWTLPKNARRMWLALSDTPMTARQLEAGLQLSRETIWRLARKLANITDDTGQPLLVKGGDGWRRSGDPGWVAASSVRKTAYARQYRQEREEKLPRLIEAKRALWERRKASKAKQFDVIILRPRLVEGERKKQMDKRRPRQAATERRQSAETLRMVPTLQWAMSCGETGRRLVGWIVAIRMCQQGYRVAA
jgi:hypothetical protein